MKKILFWVRLFVLHEYDSKGVRYKKKARKIEWDRQKGWGFEYINKYGQIDYTNA